MEFVVLFLGVSFEMLFIVIALARRTPMPPVIAMLLGVFTTAGLAIDHKIVNGTQIIPIDNIAMIIMLIPTLFSIGLLLTSQRAGS